MRELWNSWSAGGRNGKVEYTALGISNGQWTGDSIPIKKVASEEGFRAGDIIYFDYSSFPEWQKDQAKFYINFSNYGK